MKPEVVLAIDQGTTSVRATVMGTGLTPLVSTSEGVVRSFPKPGWVELDALAVVAATERVVRAALDRSGCDAAQVAGVGLANQGETIVLWDRRTGEPLGPAIVWQCRRTEEVCTRLKQDVATRRLVLEKTGLPIDPYFSATKLAWMLDNVPSARDRAERGQLCAGTLDTFTLFRLSQGRLFVTDPSTSCRTLLAELGTGRFAPSLSEIFRVPFGLLAEVVASDSDLGTVRIAGQALPIRALLCDQPAALLGTGCLSPGQVKCTYGTGAFLQVNTGESPIAIPKNGGFDGLLRSVAWELKGKRTYLLEGSILSAGDVLTWLRDGLGLVARPEEVEEVLGRTADTAGVSFLPALTGLGAPRWVGEVRGTLIGLSRATQREHIIRAALEGVAHQVADVLEAASQAWGRGLEPMRVDGGLSASKAFLQLQADLAGHPLTLSGRTEATTLGIAAVAASRAGLGDLLEAALTGAVHTIEPKLDPDRRRSSRIRHTNLLNVASSDQLLELCQS